MIFRHDSIVVPSERGSTTISPKSFRVALPSEVLTARKGLPRFVRLKQDRPLRRAAGEAIILVYWLTYNAPALGCQ
jgi:hypothetical protein